MPKLVNRLPRYSRHRGTGQAVVCLNGKDHYLGRYGTDASRAAYDALITQWIAGGRRLPDESKAISIAEMIVAFRRHAAEFYKDADGKVSKAAQNFDESLRPLARLFARTAAADFGPVKLAAVRQAFIDAGAVRTNVNRHVSRIRHVFKWAVSVELIPASVHHGLAALPGLRAGRSGAKESQPVKPVAVEHVETVKGFLSPTLRAMVDVMLSSAMRPGELVVMRGCDLDMSGKVWGYRPAKHKNQVHGHERLIYLGPRAQATLSRFLKFDAQAFLFSPADAERERRAELTAKRVTPLSCGNRVGTNRARSGGKKQPGERYTTMSFYRAVIRGCDAAFPVPADVTEPTAIAKWRSDHRFHVHQLRHTAGTLIRAEFGLEAAQAMLGHRSLQASQIYAEKSAKKAQEVAAKIG